MRPLNLRGVRINQKDNRTIRSGMSERLKYLLELQKHCKENGQRFTAKNARELNDLLIAYHANKLSSDERHTT